MNFFLTFVYRKGLFNVIHQKNLIMKPNRNIIRAAVAILLLSASGYYASARYNQRSSQETNRVYFQDLSEQGKKRIESELMKPLRRKLGIEKDVRTFSRCPSGLSYYIAGNPTDESPYFIGNVTNYMGCHGMPVCQFRMTKNEESLDVCPMNEDHELVGNYMPVAEFFSHPEFFASR
jgi:hypothetical protein